VNLTEHFTLEELTRSEYAIRKGLDNTPNADQLANLHVLAQGLERIRTLLGKPIRVTSGFRSIKVNIGIGGAVSSYHTKGLAADIQVDGMTPAQVCLAIESHKDQIQFDKAILEFGEWTHVQFPEPDEPPRLATYTIKSAKTGYQPGIHA
jgi:zinc D-Ala-D-Ala carboxypeptidase